jgi:hypothetical protein
MPDEQSKAARIQQVCAERQANDSRYQCPHDPFPCKADSQPTGNATKKVDEPAFVEYAVTMPPHVLPVADRALRMWLEAHGIEDGKPVFVKFEFRDHLPGATYRSAAAQSAEIASLREELKIANDESDANYWKSQAVESAHQLAEAQQELADETTMCLSLQQQVNDVMLQAQRCFVTEAKLQAAETELAQYRQLKARAEELLARSKKVKP